MAIIYSYPTDLAPTTSDLLLGSSSLDGHPTKTFSIASIAGLVNATGGTGTVTTVNTTNSEFITIQGGPITNAGTLVASLSAGGTPSDTTFLRGDNSWAPATTTGSPNVSVFGNSPPSDLTSTQITTAVTSLNFTGLGVETTNNGNDVTIDIAGATAAVTGLNPGNGIQLSASVGDVEVTNSGVLSMVAGANISLSPTNGVGTVTINAENNPGTVQSVTPGDGLKLYSGSVVSTPSIGIEYSGSNNYILVGSSIGVPTISDTIVFNENINSDVKTSTFDTIPIAALPLLQTYIDNGDANVILNSSDSYTSTARVEKVVTLTQADYTAIGVGNYDTNTLYIISTAGTLKTVNLTTITNGIISTDGTGTGTGYTLAGNTGLPQSLTGVEGEPYSFIVTATSDAAHYFDPVVTGNIVDGFFPSAATTDLTMTLAGTSLANPTPTVIATLLVVTDIQGPGSDGTGFTLGGSLSDAIQTGIAPLTVNSFATTCVANTGAGYSFTAGPTIVNASGTINGSQTVVTTVTGTLQLT